MLDAGPDAIGGEGRRRALPDLERRRHAEAAEGREAHGARGGGDEVARGGEGGALEAHGPGDVALGGEQADVEEPGPGRGVDVDVHGAGAGGDPDEDVEQRRILGVGDPGDPERAVAHGGGDGHRDSLATAAGDVELGAGVERGGVVIGHGAYPGRVD